VSSALDHIDGWEEAGLIDRDTADRLRLAQGGFGVSPARRARAMAVPARSAAARMFGPSVSVAEVFTYLGGAFLLAAWSAFMARTAGNADDPGILLGFMSLLAAGALVAIGLRLSTGDERASRAAGVALLLAVTYVGGAMAAFADTANIEWPLLGVLATAAALLAAIAIRVAFASVLTEVAVLASLTAFAGSLLSLAQETFFPQDVSDVTGLPVSSGADPMILVVASAAWWLMLAVGIALLGLWEARRGVEDHDPAASRRAAVSRFWAGIVAVLGLGYAVTRSATLAGGDYGRVLEPWIGSLALLLLSAVLIERAFRRDATSFVYAAALGLILALTDINVSYLSDSTELALLIEGLILLGVGVAADRLRRRVGRGQSEGHDGLARRVGLVDGGLAPEAPPATAIAGAVEGP
jgi:hypothetical protein